MRELGVQEFRFSASSASALIKLVEDPDAGQAILAAKVKSDGSKSLEKITDHMASSIFSTSKKSAKSKKSKSKAVDKPLKFAPLNSKSFNRKTSGRQAIKDAVLRGYHSFRDVYDIELNGKVATQHKIMTSKAGQSCSWDECADLAIDYFLTKYAMLTPQAFSIKVCEEIRVAVGCPLQFMKLMKRIITNFVTPDLKPITFKDSTAKGSKA